MFACKGLLRVVAAALLCTASAQAGSYTNTFSSNPSDLDFGGTLWDGVSLSHTGSTGWIPSGGAGPIGGTTNGPVAGVAGDGFLRMAFATPACGLTPTGFSSYLCGGILLPDFDDGLVIDGFTIECDLRIGNGSPGPAGGLSINYLPYGDPVLSALYAGDTFPEMNGRVSPNGGRFSDDGSSTNLSLMEDGTTTGVSFGFHLSDGGNYTTPPASPAVGVEAPGITHDGIGLDIRVNGVLLAIIPMPNGTTQATADQHGNPLTAGDPNGNKAATDSAAIETGPYDGTGCDTNPSWCHFKMTMNTCSGLSVWWKNVALVTNMQTSFFPSVGRFLLASRVGGNTANIELDNLRISTLPAATDGIGNAPQATPVGVSVGLLWDSPCSTIDTNGIQMEFNGAAVTPTSVTEVGGQVTVSYWNVSQPLPPGSTITVTVTFRDNLGFTHYETPAEIVVPFYVPLPATLAVTNVDLTQPGFSVKTYHVWLAPLTVSNLLDTPLQQMEISVRRGEEELAGLLGPNDSAISGVYAETGVINYSSNTNSATGFGHFNLTTDPADPSRYADKAFPGINNAAVEDPTVDNIAAEFAAYIGFPEQGVYNLTFISDGGFRMTAGKPANDQFNATLIGQCETGGCVPWDVNTLVYVPAAGFYPFRAIYFEGGGGNCEWEANELYPTATTNDLINDVTCPTTLLAYRASRAACPAAVTFTDPVAGSGTYTPNWPVEVQITDGTDGPINQGSIALYLNGAAVTPTTSKSGAVTTLQYTPPTMFASGSANTLGISFKDASGNSRSNAVPFNVISYTVIPPSMALPPTVVDQTKAGFNLHTCKYQGFVQSASEYPLPSSVFVSEMEDHGFLAWPNAADLTVNWHFNGPGGTYVETNVINYNGATAPPNEGHYADGHGTNMPGIPPITWPAYDGTTVSDGNNGQNDYIVEINTVLDLQPGLYQMGVNSDDGFSVSVGNPAEWRTLKMTLGEYDGTRGASDTDFYFYVTRAGLYPFRCLYYEGGGGNNLEWYTRSAYPGNNLHILLNDPSAVFQAGTNKTHAAVTSYQYPFGTAKGAPYVSSYGPSAFHRNGDAASITASTHTGYDAPVYATIEDGDTAVDPSTVELWVNGAPVTPRVSKTGSTTSVNYAPPANWTPNTTNTLSLAFLDRTITWSFMVEDHRNATFFIEAEDFDYNGGQTVPTASIMPYYGGAYAGLGAEPNVDYFRPDQFNCPWYRVAGPSQALNPNVPMWFNYDLDRGVNEVQANYRIGWIGSDQWYNYTRTFPAGNYNAYAGISNGGNVGWLYFRYGILQLVSATTTNNLGLFEGLATGQWGLNGGVGQPAGLVPLTDPNGNLVTLALSGKLTLRYWLPAATTTPATVAGIPTLLQNGSGDFDFILFTPATPLPSLRIAQVDGQVIITFTGTLSASPTVNGPYQDVPGATSPYTVPAGTPTTFFRAHF